MDIAIYIRDIVLILCALTTISYGKKQIICNNFCQSMELFKDIGLVIVDKDECHCSFRETVPKELEWRDRETKFDHTLLKKEFTFKELDHLKLTLNQDCTMQCRNMHFMGSSKQLIPLAFGIHFKELTYSDTDRKLSSFCACYGHSGHSTETKAPKDFHFNNENETDIEQEDRCYKQCQATDKTKRAGQHQPDLIGYYVPIIFRNALTKDQALVCLCYNVNLRETKIEHHHQKLDYVRTPHDNHPTNG